MVFLSTLGHAFSMSGHTVNYCDLNIWPVLKNAGQARIAARALT